MEDLFTLKTFLHYTLHFVFPVLVAILFYNKKWKTVSVIFLLTMLVDLDHLLATPIFDPNRFSIGFHPLHSYFMIGVYALGFVLFKKNIRLVCLGLLLHMATDFQDFYFWN